MFYSIGSIPLEKALCIEEAGKEAGLKPQKGAVPFVVGPVRACLNPEKTSSWDKDVKDLIEWFPIKDNVWTMETADDKSPLYEGPGGSQDLPAMWISHHGCVSLGCDPTGAVWVAHQSPGDILQHLPFHSPGAHARIVC